MRRSITCCWLTLLVSACFVAVSRGEWQPGFGPGTFDVRALCFFQGQLVAGGGGPETPLAYIARWDGTTWQPMGSVNAPVRTLAIFNGELIAGGQFTIADGQLVNGVARWDGATWRPMGSGPAPGSNVTALVVRAGQLFAAGSMPDEQLKRWTGTQWQGLSFGIFARELAVHEEDLIAGGIYISSGGYQVVTRWNGVTFTDLSQGLDGDIGAIVSWNGQLVVGGAFTHASGAAVNHLVVWNGSGWSPLSSGVDATVQCLAVAPDGKLVVGGDFTSAGGIPAAHIATWDGSSWAALGAGTDGRVLALASDGITLAVGGSFTMAGGTPAVAVAAWDGASWSAFSGLAGGAGLDAGPLALAIFRGDLIAAGAFRNAGNTLVNFIARWGGATWHPLGSGMNSIVTSLAVHEDRLVAGGYFTQAGGVAASHVAAWDGVSWSPLGAGFDGIVRGLAVFEDDLIAGGDFNNSGSTLTSRVARWNGSSWSSMAFGFDRAVYGFTVHAGTLIAFGILNYTYVINLNHGVAQWSGTSWENVGSGLGAVPILAACSYGGELVVGAAPPVGVKRFDGSNWLPVGGGVFRSGPGSYIVNALGLYHGQLVVAGSFDTAGGETANNIALWNGSQWTALAEGTWGNATVNPGRIDAVAAADGSLFIGGEFLTAGIHPSLRIGHWYDPRTSDALALGSVSNTFRAAPNPFNPNTAIRFDLTRPGDVDLRIYDVAGRQVRALVRGALPPERHRVFWDGTDDRGQPLPSGTYVCHLRTPDGRRSMKVTLLR